MNIINEIMTFKEATERWGLKDSTLRKMTTTDRLKENIDYRKSGGTWIITIEAMQKLYGNEKMKKNTSIYRIKNE